MLSKYNTSALVNQLSNARKISIGQHQIAFDLSTGRPLACVATPFALVCQNSSHSSTEAICRFLVGTGDVALLLCADPAGNTFAFGVAVTGGCKPVAASGLWLSRNASTESDNSPVTSGQQLPVQFLERAEHFAVLLDPFPQRLG